MQAGLTDDNLQRLCSLLDVVDHWVVDRWEKPRHDDRMTTFANMRAEAREANRLVSLSIRARQVEVGRANGARRTEDRPVPSPAPLSAAGAVTAAQGVITEAQPV
ncbi:MAG TPA: hypothetical protein VGV93_05105 [Acidimicrobiales bacterium]|nr:hypothetical protein [Acidimicrobiales bacterium]